MTLLVVGVSHRTAPVTLLDKVALVDGVTQADLDAAADEITAGVDDVVRGQLERSVARINAIYGAPARIAMLADDILATGTPARPRCCTRSRCPARR